MQRREPPINPVGAPLDYRIIMAPTQQNWLYACATRARAGPVSCSSATSGCTRRHYRNEYQYGVRSWPETVLGRELSDWRRKDRNGVTRRRTTRAPARWRALSVRPVRRALRRASAGVFSREAFSTRCNRRCSPAAISWTAFCLNAPRFLRALCLCLCGHGAQRRHPARIVGGYLGGEVNPVNRTVIVHQFDAHAWNEVWLEGRGWVRVDPDRSGGAGPYSLRPGARGGLGG
jgi:hypothetical protein